MAACVVEEDSTMELVVKNIYTSCDPENSNLVPVSKLIDFIRPYMIEDLSVLESLKEALDPQNTNVCVSSEKFYEIMNEWTKKIVNVSDENSDFNKTPSQLDAIDENQLPYTQSTPRASFGQKLLSCEGLLNLSNVSSYSLSISTLANENNPDKTILEEEVKRLEHHLNRVSNEMMMVKLHLTATEEHNEMLQADLDRCKIRLHSEQQIIEHLQTDKKFNDELREELDTSKKQVEELNKKVVQYEKDNVYLQSIIDKTNKENSELEQKCEDLSRRELEVKKQLIDIKTELDLKDQEITTVLKINEELKMKLNEQRDIIDQLTCENELLDHKKSSLEKAFRENMSARRDSIVSQYKTCLADSSCFPGDQNSEEEYYVKVQETDYKNFPHDSLQTEMSQVSFDTNKVPCSLLSFERNEKYFKEQDEHFNKITQKYLEEIEALRIKNDKVQLKLDQVNKNNDTLSLEISTMKDKIVVLEQDISNFSREKELNEKHLQEIQLEKNKLVNECRDLRAKNSILSDENNNLLGTNKTIDKSLKLKSKITAELEEKLLELKREYTNLQMEQISKDKEICEYKNKFNFETAYKNLQMELNQKNKEISEILSSNDYLQESLVKMSNTNKELQDSLDEANVNLKEYEDKSKQMMMINENIEQTASQVQGHINRKNVMIKELVELNKKFEGSINKLQAELQDKFQEITDLRESVKSDMEIKNMMWHENKDLQLKLDAEHRSNETLLQELLETQNNIKREKENYNTLLSKYNHEIEKNCDLSAENMQIKEKLSSIIDKYNQESGKNQFLCEKLSTYKTEIEVIKEGQIDCKTTVNNRLSSYEDLIKNLDKKLEELRIENDILKVELELERKKPKKERFFEVDVTSSETGRNRSFERQLMQIDRLKARLESSEAQLKVEKEKSTQLINKLNEKYEEGERYSKLQLECEQREKNTKLENQKLQYTNEDLQRINKELQQSNEELEHKNREFSEKLEYQEAQYKDLESYVNEKETDLSLKLSQTEEMNQHLFAELTNKDSIINNIYVEMERMKNSDEKAQELSANLRAKLSELNEREKEVQHLKAELAESSNKIFGLYSKISEQEIELSKSLDVLGKTQEINVKLENECASLQERMDKFNINEEELAEAEQKLKSTSRLLQCNEMELSVIEKKLSNTKTEYESLTNEISEHKNMISRSNSELSRAFTEVLNKWGGDLELEDVYKELLFTKNHEKGDNLPELDNKIKFAVYLLQLWVDKFPTLMEDSEFGLNGLKNVENNTETCSLSDGKTIKKFTLRPPRFSISRPASPDSPSVDIGYRDSVSLNGTYLNKSPDRCMCKEVSFNDDSFTSAYDELSFSQFPDHFELTPFQDSFLNVSDKFLEKEGLHDTSPKKGLSEKETEELFTTFAIQIVLDSKDIKERLEKQNDRCTEYQMKFESLIKDISSRLRDHKCIGAVDPINPVFILLEDLKYLLKDLTQSTAQFGVLTCENRMMKCWNLVTNYMALLKQKDALDSSPMSRSKTDSEIKSVKHMGETARKRQKILKKKDGKNAKSPVILDDTKVKPHRWNYFPSTFTTTLVTFLIFFTVLLLIAIHWQCRMAAPDSQACLLDDFIKKIQVGAPPY